MSIDIASDIENAAGLIERHDWRAAGLNSLVGTTSTYAARAYVRQIVAPGEYRADGTRTNRTADEVLSSLLPEIAAAVLRGVALRARQRGAAYIGGNVVELGQ